MKSTKSIGSTKKCQTREDITHLNTEHVETVESEVLGNLAPWQVLREEKETIKGAGKAKGKGWKAPRRLREAANAAARLEVQVELENRWNR